MDMVGWAKDQLRREELTRRDIVGLVEYAHAEAIRRTARGERAGAQDALDAAGVLDQALATWGKP